MPDSISHADQKIGLQNKINQLIALYNQGAYGEIVQKGNECLKENPTSSRIHNILGISNSILGKSKKGIFHLRRALELRPDHPEAYNNLGLLLTNERKYEEAIKLFDQAIKLDPKCPEAYNNLGTAYKDTKKYTKAIACYETAISLKSRFPEAVFNLGVVLNVLGDITGAKKNFSWAIVLNPKFAEAHNNLGKILLDEKEYHKAISYLEQAIRINPYYSEALSNLGDCHFKIRNFAAAEGFFNKALQFEPRSKLTTNKLISFYSKAGKIPKAEKLCLNLLKEKPNCVQTLFRYVLMTPEIIPSLENIKNQRAHLKYKVETCLKNKNDLNLEDLVKAGSQVTPYNFLLSYDGLCTKKMHGSIGEIFDRNISNSPRLPTKRKSQNKNKIRIGLYSEFILLNHAISYWYKELFLKIDKRQFELICFTQDKHLSLMSHAIKEYEEAGIKVMLLPTDHLLAARDIIFVENLDILYYTDIGMHTSSYFLAANRLAPIQFTGPGHPDTTGLKSIDYYLSYKGFEPVNAQNNYNESLFIFNNLFMAKDSFSKNILSKEKPSKSEFSLPENSKLYGCFQSLFKIHPEFDYVLQRIVELDNHAKLIFFRIPSKFLEIQLKQRWSKSYPKLLEHVIFFDQMPFDQYLSFSRLMDVHLDPVHFGMGTTAHQMLALNKPVITWKSEFMRGRIVSAMYQRLGVPNPPVVNKIGDYSKMAVEWAYEENLSLNFSKYLENNQLESEDEKNAYIKEFEGFLFSSYENSTAL